MSIKPIFKGTKKIAPQTSWKPKKQATFLGNLFFWLNQNFGIIYKRIMCV